MNQNRSQFLSAARRFGRLAHAYVSSQSVGHSPSANILNEMPIRKGRPADRMDRTDGPSPSCQRMSYSNVAR
ncbi:protein of unknown function [Nitrospira japonica]|uniref:Uncharacterized protein n=1 Tax=Nitrospira japonica TaxID=1325564 RepID=A0A1W1I7W9_9BACT|nr:protein of unknown function [Nitrospira japonica]